MTRIITYSLKLDAPRSDEYHRAISAFADAWLSGIPTEVHELIEGFRTYRLDLGQADRSDAEFAFELLALGVLLREHGREAGRTPPWASHLLSRLLALQERLPRLEKALKGLRGWLSWLAGLLPARERGDDPIDELIDWVGAADEAAKQERIRQWQAYLSSRENDFTRTALSLCTRMADDFAEASLAALGKYTGNVEHFLAQDVSRKRRRYDARLLMRTRLEYHLGMLGTELLNRAYRQSFLATRRKMVILPPCMCAPRDECRAVETPYGARCQACTPGCRVHQVTKLGEKHGFCVTMIPDDVKVFGGGQDTGSIGLVGVSCALTNWNGGWEAGALGIPCQGLLLDHVGCKYHWDKQGLPTDVSLKRLREILGV